MNSGATSRSTWRAILLASLLTIAACTNSLGGSSPASSAPFTATSPTSTLVLESTTTTAPLTADAPCGRVATSPTSYRHVVVVVLENRTFNHVGGPSFSALPYLASIAAQCTVYTDWTEINTKQNSLTQYIGLTSGVDNPTTVNDCSPSDQCHSTDDNIFRQVRDSGGSARTFVEGPSTGCSAKGNAVKHVPALYYFAPEDVAACETEVRPLSEFDVDQLPTFAMVVPDLCNDGHDCPNNVVDDWLRGLVGGVLNGANYRSGDTAVFVLYDEDHPVPNVLIAPTARAIQSAEPGAGHRAVLRTIEEMLGLPILPSVVDAISLRPSSGV